MIKTERRQGGEPATAVVQPEADALAEEPVAASSRLRSVLSLEWLNLPALIAVTIWSASFPIAKYALDEFHVLSYTALRPFLAVPLGLALLRLRGEGIGIARADWPRLLAAGVFGMAAFQLFFIVGLERTSASHSALIASAGPPILGALVLWAWRGERPVRRAAAGLLLGFLGVALLVGDPNAAGASILGDLISMVAALAWVVVTIVPAPLVRRYGPIRVSTWLAVCSGVTFVPFSLGPLRETARDVPSLLAWASLVYTALLGMVMANALWHRAVQTIGANRTIAYLYLQPLLALALAAVMLGERFGPLQLGGGLLAMAGVALVTGRR